MPRNGCRSHRERTRGSVKHSNGGIARFRMSEDNETRAVSLLSHFDALMTDSSYFKSSTAGEFIMSGPVPSSIEDDDNDESSEEDEENSDESLQLSVDDDQRLSNVGFTSLTVEDEIEMHETSNSIQVTSSSLDVNLGSPLAPEVSLKSMTKKLLRDERKSEKDGTGATPTRAAKSLFMKRTYATNLTSQKPVPPTTPSTAPVAKAVKSKALLSSTVLLEVYLEGVDSSKKKPVVVSRQESIESVTNIIRKKLNASKKHDALVMIHPVYGVRDGSRLLTEIALLDIHDSSAVTLIRSIDHPALFSDNKAVLTHADNTINITATSESIMAVDNRSTINEQTSVCDLSNGIPSSAIDSNLESSSLATLPNESRETEQHLSLCQDKVDDNSTHQTAWVPPQWNDIDRAIDIGTHPIDNLKNQTYLDQHIHRMNSAEYASILSIRRALPIHDIRSDLISAVRQSQVVVVSGATGSGKTTQLPHYILEDAIENHRACETFIICTQPRRIAAMSVAERVAYERMEDIGHSVGFQIRLHSKLCADTKILFCTTGVLLSRIQDPAFLHRVSHVIIDEVHERQVETDFLMTILRDRLNSYTHLKLVLMSATLEEDLLSTYFKCPIMYVQGRTHPVEDHFLDDCFKFISSSKPSDAKPAVDDGSLPQSRQQRRASASGLHKLLTELKTVRPGLLHKHAMFYDFMAELVATIIRRNTTKAHESTCGDGILVFLSGINAIKKLQGALRRQGLGNGVSILILHGSLPPEQQKRVFRTTNPGEWKIILATNIAETSITVDDVTHVIDSGMMKEVRFDPDTNISSLQEVLISRAASKQRAGRAGRVRPGHCWKMYSREYFDSSSFASYPVPEICRVPLEEVVLQVLLLRLGLPETFLARCLQPPSISQIRASVSLLLEVNAILPQAGLPLTPLGYHLARIPMDVRLGKMLIVSTLLGVEELALTVAASLCGKSPFLCPIEKLGDANKAHASFLQHRISKSSSNTQSAKIFSDHLAVVNAFNQWHRVRSIDGREAAFVFARKNFLSSTSFEEIYLLRGNFRRHLIQAGFIFHPQPATSNIAVNNEDDDCAEEDAVDDIHLSSAANIRPLDPVPNKTYSMEELMLTLGSICAGLSPNIARVSRFVDRGFEVKRGKGRGRRDMLPARIQQADGKEIFVHPSSNLCRQLSEVVDNTGSPNAFLVFHKKMAMDKVFLFDCSSVPLAAVLVFGGELTIIKHKNLVLLNGWIPVKMSELHAVLVKRLQREIDTLLADRINKQGIAQDVDDTTNRQEMVLGVLRSFLLTPADVMNEDNDIDDDEDDDDE